jgi:predicted  nucleic acid-binding Zn-ribbon protein
MNNGNQPATKADVAAVRSDLEGVREQIRDTETKLLTAFYDFAKVNQQRLSELEGSDAAIKRRIGSIEDRLLEVEKRLNMPPAA